MHAYKFRVTSDENDEFFREIEVLANQSFEDFHKAIVTTCKFQGNELASFYLCDNQWRKRREITLVDMNLEPPTEESTANNLIMKDSKLNQVINDPHQRIIYVYDYLNMFTVYIELMKIYEADMTIPFPRVTKEASDIFTPVAKKSAILEDVEEGYDEDDIKAHSEDEEEEDPLNEDEEFFDEDATLS